MNSSIKSGLKGLVLMVCLLSLAAPAFGKTTEVEILVDDAFRPFSFLDNGEAKGIYIEVLKAASAKMTNFHLKFVAIPWKRGKKAMEDGTGFGLFPAYYHGHDWDYLYPYSLPVYVEKIIAVCTAQTLETPRIHWPQDYQGLSIGNVAGFDGWGGDEFRALVKEGKIKYEEAKGSEENILKLANDRLNCIMMEEAAFDYSVRKLVAEGKQVEAVQSLKKGATVGEDASYIGYSKPARLKQKYPFQFEFMQEFDSVIYKMHKSGEIKKIMEAYRD